MKFREFFDPTTYVTDLSSDYHGPIIIRVECIDLNNNLNTAPYKYHQFVFTYFTSIINITSTGSKKKKKNQNYF